MPDLAEDVSGALDVLCNDIEDDVPSTLVTDVGSDVDK